MEEKINIVKAFKKSNDQKFFQKMSETRSSLKDFKTMKLSEIYRDIYSKDISGTLQFLQRTNGLLKNDENQNFFKTMSRK
jgi:hypothetical protein